MAAAGKEEIIGPGELVLEHRKLFWRARKTFDIKVFLLGDKVSLIGKEVLDSLKTPRECPHLILSLARVEEAFHKMKESSHTSPIRDNPAVPKRRQSLPAALPSLSAGAKHRQGPPGSRGSFMLTARAEMELAMYRAGSPPVVELDLPVSGTLSRAGTAGQNYSGGRRNSLPPIVKVKPGGESVFCSEGKAVEDPTTKDLAQFLVSQLLLSQEDPCNGTTTEARLGFSDPENLGPVQLAVVSPTPHSLQFEASTSRITSDERKSSADAASGLLEADPLPLDDRDNFSAPPLRSARRRRRGAVDYGPGARLVLTAAAEEELARARRASGQAEDLQRGTRAALAALAGVAAAAVPAAPPATPVPPLLPLGAAAAEAEGAASSPPPARPRSAAAALPPMAVRPLPPPVAC
uniref:Uncharacterized protein n=1 Tax=Heterosigma akashiwo TaxID=2829 RepID=A0A7S3YMS8_HETAK